MYESVAKLPCGEVTVAKLPCGEVTGNPHNRGEVRTLLTPKKHNFLGEESVSVPYVSKSQSIKTLYSNEIAK